MFELLWAGILLVALLFGGVVLFGAPYLPTLAPQINAALDLLELDHKGQKRLIEVGSGDGRVLLAAAQRGWQVTGYEINPLLVLYSKFRTRKYSGSVTVRWKNVWRQNWPETDAVFVFGLQKLLPKVYKKVIQSNSKAVKLVSVGYELSDHTPHAQHEGVFLYVIKPEK